MYAVGRIGSYISRGVYTVSGPFHPFGGAVDIIVVEQPDGSFKSSPWYVRFGKFQGVLKTREKVVSIDVNGVEADFHMYLDHKGEAYFLKEVDNEEEESVVLYPSSSGDETDGQSSSNMRPMKSKSCNYDSDRLNFADQIDGSDEQILSRTDSRRAKYLGLVFGRRSIMEDDYREGKDGVVRLSSLERAEIAADLLEVKWSTNLASSRARKDYDSRFSSPDVAGEEMAKAKQVNAEHSQAESLVHDAEKNSTNNSTLHKEIGSQDEQVANNSHSSSVILESSVQKASTEVSSIGTKEQVVETPKLGESMLEENCEMVSEISRRLDGFSVGNAYHDGCEEQMQPDSKIRCELEALDGKNFDKELACKEKDLAFPGCGISNESESDTVQSFVCCETSESSVVGPDDSNEQTQGLDSGGCREVHVHLETLHVTTELLPKDADNEFGKDPVEASRNHSDQMNAALCELDSNATDLEKPFIVQESSTQIVSVDPAHGSIKEVESQNICSAIHQPLASIGDSQKLFSDNVLEKVASNSLSEGSEEEQFLFSDLDESKVNELVDSSFPDCVKEVDHPLSCDEGNKEMNGSVNQTEELCSSPNMLVTDLENSKEESSVMSSPVDIPKNHMGGENVERLVESLPIIWSPTANLSAGVTQHPLSHSLDSNSKLLKWTWLSENDSGCMKSDADEEQQLAQEQPNTENTQISEELKAVLSSPKVGDTSKTIISPGGSWRLWPFSLSRSSSRKDMQPALSDIKYSDAEIASEIINDIDGAKIVCKSAEIASKIINDMDGAKIVCKSKVGKKIIRSITPTSEQLASLNLEEGSNTITFRFFTPMLGKQQVDARVYLWKWDNRIVISDVDGTITKSDVLGQFMPLVGMDWSQTGVVHLFQAIKENGYRFLYLSARSITQAYHTRQFLFNLKQDGKALPEGPVVISPDGLFPSLFREVIRRAPHEFKISCLEDIRALFPSDCYPFYAGFGNRDTDEISYLKVGIPRGKIFTINPKGEIAVNRSVDTKSYTSLHAHVHGMFPTMTSSEQILIIEGVCQRILLDPQNDEMDGYYLLPLLAPKLFRVDEANADGEKYQVFSSIC